MENQLYQITKDHPNHNLIAILHGGINLALIAYITGQLRVMDNCGLYVLERMEGRLKVIEDYISPEQMRKAMEQTQQIRKKRAVR